MMRQAVSVAMVWGYATAMLPSIVFQGTVRQAVSVAKVWGHALLCLVSDSEDESICWEEYLIDQEVFITSREGHGDLNRTAKRQPKLPPRSQ